VKGRATFRLDSRPTVILDEKRNEPLIWRDRQTILFLLPTATDKVERRTNEIKIKTITHQMKMQQLTLITTGKLTNGNKCLKKPAIKML
jgi:hypothetical protein